MLYQLTIIDGMEKHVFMAEFFKFQQQCAYLFHEKLCNDDTMYERIDF